MFLRDHKQRPCRSEQLLTWLLLAYYKLGSTKQEAPLVEFSRATIKLQARMTLLGMIVLSSQELRHMCQTWFKDNCVLVWNNGLNVNIDQLIVRYSVTEYD